jgi:pimeloyl-ACP methyl ester carboxylesterase
MKTSILTLSFLAIAFLSCQSNDETSNTPLTQSCDVGLTGEPIQCEPDFILGGITFSERYVTAGGIDWHVVEAGNLDAPIIFFVHGVPESWYDWHQQMIDLAPDYHVIAIDLKGYGRSGHPNADDPVGSGAYSATQVASEIVVLMDAIGLTNNITLVSHDWGTLVSSYLVLQEDARFNAWARMSAPIGGDGQEIIDLNSQFTLFQDFEFCKMVFSNEPFIHQLYGYDGVLGLNTSQSIPNEIVDRVYEEWHFDELTTTTAAKYYSDSPEIADPDFWSNTLVQMASTITFPVFLIQAEDDSGQPLHLFDNAESVFQQATLYPISESGHFMMSEQPDKITQAIRELIEQ